MFDAYDAKAEGMRRRCELSFDSREVLENTVLPVARRWLAKYPQGSTMHEHAEETLSYWGEL